jgi:membrane associated rhomboid family serine protease
MGLYDRDYTREQNEAYPYYAPQMRLGFPSITPAVKWLLIANIVVFLVDKLASDPRATGLTLFEKLFALNPASPLLIIQLWRLITYQFLHGDFFHILYNMLCLFFLGPVLERHWGTKKFFTFYLSCGIAGGVFYILLVVIGFLTPMPLIGASGAVLGVLTACAILFPRIIIFFFFFPMPIRVVAIILICIASVTILSKGANAGGEAAHLAGIAAGAFYVLSKPWRTALKLRFKANRWEKYAESERKFHIEVDRILKKVHDSGLHALTPSEKRILKKATRLEQTRSKP